MSLAACSGGASEAAPASGPSPASKPESSQETVEIPTGIWVLRFYGNENGEYEEELNLSGGGYGRPMDDIQKTTLDYGHLACFELDETGKGTYMDMWDKVEDVIFDGSSISFADGREVPYTRDGDRLWFEDQYNEYYNVMENVSEELFDKIKNGAYACVDPAKAEIGDMVSLGTYETWPYNDKTEALRWRVIDKNGSDLLIICDELIDAFSYNYNPDMTGLNDVTWENSSLRAFLNDPEGFLCCFTDDEIAMILTTHLENNAANEELMRYFGDFQDTDSVHTYSDMAVQDLPDDPATDDMVFLLSFQEVEKYFGTATGEYPGESDYPFDSMPASAEWLAYVSEAVDYNFAGAGYYDFNTFAGAWMTRTLATDHHDEKMVTYITGQGQVFLYFTYTPMFIRPAMWIHVG